MGVVSSAWALSKWEIPPFFGPFLPLFSPQAPSRQRENRRFETLQLEKWEKRLKKCPNLPKRPRALQQNELKMGETGFF